VRGAHTSVDDCESCGHRFALDHRERGSFLVCSDPNQETPSATLSEPSLAKDRTPSVSEIMAHDVLCVLPSTSLSELLVMLLEHGFSGAPVVDENQSAIGIVSKSDLLDTLAVHRSSDEAHFVLTGRDGTEYDLGPGFRAEALAELTVGDVMTEAVCTLPEEAPVSRAAAMMSLEGVHRVPITDSNGHVVGLLSSLDVLRWLARQAGYVVPGRTARQANEETTL
jgi:CBS domain-containing protein